MDIEALKKLLNNGQDSAMLRFTLARQYAQQDEFDTAISHLQLALEQDPEYTAAWNLLGECQTKTDQPEAAINTYRQGIEIANKTGDIQTGKMMRVFLKRLQKM